MAKVAYFQRPVNMHHFMIVNYLTSLNVHNTDITNAQN